MKRRFSMYKDLLKNNFETHLKENETIYSLEIGSIDLPTGQIVATDPFSLYELDAFLIHVEPGSYPVSLYIHQFENDKRVGLSLIRFTDQQPITFEMAYTQTNKDVLLRPNEYVGYSVDSGMGAFMDAKIIDLLQEYQESQAEKYLQELEVALDQPHQHTYSFATYKPEGAASHLVAFSTGFGDGVYPSYFGFDENNEVCCLITDFLTMETISEKEFIDWGKVYDSGYNHSSKVNTMNLAIEEINGFNHLAVYLRWAYEHDLLSDLLLENCPELPLLMRNSYIDIRKILIKEEAFCGRLRSKHFNDLGEKFTDYFYVFNKGSIDYYPHCVDEFAKEVLGQEKYYSVEYKDEAYLFNPYGESYYQGLSKYIDRVWKLFLKK